MNKFVVNGLSPPELNKILGVSTDLGLFEIFSYFFEGKLETDDSMIEILENAFFKDSPYCFCLKLGNSFCWFTVGKSRLYIKGKLIFSEPISTYSVGKFIKKLRYSIAKSGVSLGKVTYLVWDEADLKGFEGYIIKYNLLSEFFNKIDGCKGLKCSNIMRLLSKERGGIISYNAEQFVDCLNDSYDILGLNEIDGVLYSKNVFYKDYSNCVSSLVSSKECSFGIVLDTEGIKGSNGALSNGVGELGGIIFCRYKGILLNVTSFTCDALLVSETVSQTIKRVRELSGDSRKPINTFIFGRSDIKMLQNSLPIKLFKQLTFIDCKPIILKSYNLSSSSQSDIANELRVALIKPKHNPLSDAKTLFNILAKLVEDNPSIKLEKGV